MKQSQASKFIYGINLKSSIFNLQLLDPNPTVFFVEVQFQEDEFIYHRLFAEIFVFLQQNPQYTHWQAVVIFPSKSLEPEDVGVYSLLLESTQVQRFYLNKLEQVQ
ncbi:MAG: DUF2887 domain-containing protein, partial [Symploca sp. SIO2E6]|nr:DUF2887 domain-containing protein [Symploca sp. SIO2E6]